MEEYIEQEEQLDEEFKSRIISMCSKHLPSDDWFEKQFKFIKEDDLKERLVKEFKGIRFAYKFYACIGAKDENLLFEVRSQILSYASIYEFIIHYVLYTYYYDAPEFVEIRTNKKYFKNQSLKTDLLDQIAQHISRSEGLSISSDKVAAGYYVEKDFPEENVRFDSKCKVAKKLGIIKDIINPNTGEIVDLSQDIIEVYKYRNCIHITAEKKRDVNFENELELSRKAYRRMQPFLEQVRNKLVEDKKITIE